MTWFKRLVLRWLVQTGALEIESYDNPFTLGITIKIRFFGEVIGLIGWSKDKLVQRNFV